MSTLATGAGAHSDGAPGGSTTGWFDRAPASTQPQSRGRWVKPHQTTKNPLLWTTVRTSSLCDLQRHDLVHPKSACVHRLVLRDQDRHVLAVGFTAQDLAPHWD